MNDAAIFEMCDLGKMLKENLMPLPLPKYLPKTRIQIPFFFIGDSGFPLRKYMMTPFARCRRILRTTEKIYNYRISRCRRQIESAFGILAKKWRILQTSLNFHPEKTKIVVMALLCLHNYILTEESDCTYTADDNDEAFVPLDNVERARPRGDCIDTALEQRSKLKKYFVSQVGKVHWQKII